MNLKSDLFLQEIDVLAKGIVINPNGLWKTQPLNSNDDAPATTSLVVQPPLPRRHSLGVARHQCKTHEGQARPHLSRRPWDAWERRSLKKQVRDIVGQNSTCSSRYSQGSEILKAIQKLKSRSHS